ncbi:MAG: tetratricopeptide repeat protein, partial [Alphaproteobacteria bacterium]|nr:tetratricopeptide repeat protein [Alphaproteobacteria bacterium]
ADALADRGQKLAQEGRAAEAIASFDRAIREAPDNLSYRLNLAILYDREGHYPEALALYREVLTAWESTDDLSAMPPSLPAILRRAEYLAQIAE